MQFAGKNGGPAPPPALHGPNASPIDGPRKRTDADGGGPLTQNCRRRSSGRGICGTQANQHSGGRTRRIGARLRRGASWRGARPDARGRRGEGADVHPVACAVADLRVRRVRGEREAPARGGERRQGAEERGGHGGRAGAGAAGGARAAGRRRAERERRRGRGGAACMLCDTRQRRASATQGCTHRVSPERDALELVVRLEVALERGFQRRERRVGEGERGSCLWGRERVSIMQ